MKKSDLKNGFTLVELIIVVAIIGVLLAISIPRLADYTTIANNRAIEANIRHIIDVIRIQYAADLIEPDEDMIENIINSFNINDAEVSYSGKSTDIGIVLKYSSTVTRYSGTSGYNTEPTTAADLNDNSKMNDGTPVQETYFVYDFGILQ